MWILNIFILKHIQINIESWPYHFLCQFLLGGDTNNSMVGFLLLNAFLVEFIWRGFILNKIDEEIILELVSIEEFASSIVIVDDEESRVDIIFRENILFWVVLLILQGI